MFRVDCIYNLIKIPLNTFKIPIRQKWLTLPLKYARLLMNTNFMKLYFCSNTISNYYLYPILMSMLQNKILVLVILAFI
jgi:hypothetical protein